MGDVNGEPSMEEILSSIKRIIAEEGDVPGRSRRPARVGSSSVEHDHREDHREAAYREPSSRESSVRESGVHGHDFGAGYADDEIDDDEILELSDPMPMVERTPRTPKSPVLTSVDAAAEARQSEPRHPEPRQPAAKPQHAPEPAAEPIVSRQTAAATRAPLEALTRMMVKPDTGNDGTLEGLVREMLRPMLREWIDANLPNMVEDMVSREIAKIMNQQP
ncbi:DUF2497 domain-containing protein [Sphingomonas sp. OK281]|uniref:DUF2497 domain-containing protein n=1 Tax=Sphingomonas sp. OK281 TaxID=1881067 RepID=UPI0008E8F554|nr:DUF2497 domain-containing protein [Sphingomonas sp. OK281]SFO18699.1 hypothetical protein SAMN05428984_2607 [Sphingomonas sp. OK281]